jgi:hypothetical protein
LFVVAVASGFLLGGVTFPAGSVFVPFLARSFLFGSLGLFSRGLFVCLFRSRCLSRRGLSQRPASGKKEHIRSHER